MIFTKLTTFHGHDLLFACRKVDEGGGAFYGPKIDLKIRDAIGRMWQCSTVQADFNLPDRFNLEYVDRSGTRTLLRYRDHYAEGLCTIRSLIHHVPGTVDATM